MSSDDLRLHLPAYADGELSGELHERVAQAVSESPELQHEVEQWRALRAAAHRGVTGEDVPAGLRERVMAQLEAAEPSATTGRPGPHPVLKLYGVLGAAAVVALLIIGWSLWIRQPATPSPPGGGMAPMPQIAANELWQRHTRSVEAEQSFDTLGVRGMEATLAQARLNEQARFVVFAPDLSAQGWHVDGATRCAIPSGDGEIEVIHVVYGADGPRPQHVSLFSLAKCVQIPECAGVKSYGACGETRTYEEYVSDGMALVKWDQGPCSYAAASGDMEVARLEGMLETLRSAETPTVAVAVVVTP